MATTFSTAKTSLDEIALRIQQNRKRMEQSQQLAAQAASDLGGMAATYGTIVTDIDAMLAASPTDDAIKAMGAEKDLLVTEFQSLKTSAAGLKTAVDKVTF